MMVFARTANDKGRNGVTCFIVDTDTPGSPYAASYIRCGVRIMRRNLAEDMRVPASNILGELNKGSPLPTID